MTQESTMTLDEAQELKRQLELDITTLVTAFSEKTKCEVEHLRLEGGALTAVAMRVPVAYVYIVTVTVRL